MNIKDSYIHNGTAVLKDVKVENSVLKKILAGKDANDAYLGWETVCDLTGIKPNAAGTADKVGHKLTFSGGVTGTWDGSADKTVTIPTKSSWNYDDIYLKLSGGTITGPIKFSNSAKSNLSNNYLSAGGGYSSNSGRLGLKLVSIDQSDIQAGIGVDLTGFTYETTISTGRRNDTTPSYITFATHNSESSSYKRLGYFKASGDTDPSVLFHVGGTIEASKFIGSLQGNASTATNADKLGNIAADNYFKHRDAVFNSEWSGKYLWTLWDNHLHAADKRLAVTLTGTTSTNFSLLFDGSFESSVSITEAKAVLHIKSTTEGNVWTEGLPYGDFYVVFYNSDAENITGRVYCNYAPQGTGWHDLPITHVGPHIWKLNNGYYQLSDLEITITKPVSSASIDLCQVLHVVERSPSPYYAAVMSKYCDQKTNYNIEAAKFIKTGGTSSQFLKADGSVDSNTYSKSNHTHSSVLDINDNNTTTFAYSKSGLNYGDYTWLAGWNGYELRAVNKSQFAQASHTHTKSQITDFPTSLPASGGYANEIASKGMLDSQEKIDNFITPNRFEYALFKTTDANNVDFASNDGMIISIPWASDIYGFQMAFDDTRNGTIKVRGKSNSWGDWYTLLHSGNYNSYAPSLTGSGASGTWGISISGNAATATTSTYTSNVGSSGTAGTNYVTASKVIAACTWYDTMIGSDSDTIINRWSEIVSFVAGFKETPDLATFLSNNYLAKAGGTITGPLKWKDNNALPQQTSPQYFLCIDAFDNGGTTKWASKSDTLKELTGLTSTAIGDSDKPVYWNGSKFVKAGAYPTKSSWNYDDRYLKLSGGNLTGGLSIQTQDYEKGYATSQQLVINGPNYDANVTLTPQAYPGIGFHMPNRTWANLIWNGSFTGMDGSFNGYVSFYGSGFKKDGSSDNYVLLGGGGHKLLSDLSMTHSHPYSKLTTYSLETGVSVVVTKSGSCIAFSRRSNGGGSKVWTYTGYGATYIRNNITIIDNADTNISLYHCDDLGFVIKNTANNTATITIISNDVPTFTIYNSTTHGDLSENSVKTVSYSDHTHTFASLTSKPTTIAGYGITDAYTKTQIDTKLNGYLSLSGGELTGKTAIIGQNTGASTISADLDALVIANKQTRVASAGYYYPGIAFNHMWNWDANKTYQNSSQAWIGLKLHSTPGSELSYLVFGTKEDTGAASRPIERMSIAPNGDVNIKKNLSVDGSISATTLYENGVRVSVSGHTHSYLPLNGGTMNLGEGLKFHADENYFGTNLDARIISLLDGNGATCDGGLIIDERATFNGVETITELLRIRDDEFTWKGNTIWHAGNDGSDSELDADLLDGYHEAYFYRHRGSYGKSYTAASIEYNLGPGTYTTSEEGFSGTLLSFNSSGSASAIQFWTHYRQGNLYYRTSVDSRIWSKTDGSWTRILDSDSYTEYTVKKDGTGASGTWGISITGSAGSVAWDNVSNKPTFTTWSETSSVASYSLSNAAWTNTITLPTTAGSYILNIVSGNSTLTGVFSIGASDSAKDEISLHLHGNGPRLYARTNGTTLQLSSNDASATSRSVTIKYRRMI